MTPSDEPTAKRHPAKEAARQLGSPYASYFFDRELNPITVERNEALMADRAYQIVRQTQVSEAHWVSTIWLGLDFGWDEAEAPVVFETICFRMGTLEDVNSRRWHTEAEAIAGHGAMIGWALREEGCPEEAAVKVGLYVAELDAGRVAVRLATGELIGWEPREPGAMLEGVVAPGWRERQRAQMRELLDSYGPDSEWFKGLGDDPARQLLREQLGDLNGIHLSLPADDPEPGPTGPAPAPGAPGV